MTARTRLILSNIFCAIGMTLGIIALAFSNVDSLAAYLAIYIAIVGGAVGLIRNSLTR